MKQEVYDNTCAAINHMGDTTKAGADPCAVRSWGSCKSKQLN